MVDNSLPVTCRACQRRVRLDQVKFDEIRKAYVCVSCYNATHPVKQSGLVRNHKTESEVKNVDTFKASLVKYSCNKCKFHFSRARDKSVKSCPYCGSNDLDILDSSSSSIVSRS